jgi:hypothetical protein
MHVHYWHQPASGRATWEMPEQALLPRYRQHAQWCLRWYPDAQEDVKALAARLSMGCWLFLAMYLAFAILSGCTSGCSSLQGC